MMNQHINFALNEGKVLILILFLKVSSSYI